MVPLILRFTQCCRAAGMAVSTAEVLDAVAQMTWIDPVQESEFRTVLKANFVKSRREQGRFDRIYTMFFHGVDTPSDDDPGTDPAASIQRVLDAVRRDSGEEDTPLIDFLSGDPLAYLQSLQDLQDREAIPSAAVKSNLGAVAGRLEIMLRLNRTRSRITRILSRPGAADPAPLTEVVKGRLMKGLDDAYALLSRDAAIDNAGLEETLASPPADQPGLSQRPFSSLSRQEVEEMREVVEKLVRKLKETVSRRWTRRDRGTLDIKTTLRRAARYHGVPIEIHFRRRPQRKGKIVTLCDVSGSVWSAARFMLSMLYALQDCFSKVRSFVFISNLVEVTDIFQRRRIDDAIDQALNHTDIGSQVQTDYGETFSRFRSGYHNILTKKTTLIIVGDARSNYMNPQEGILEEMRQRCRRLIWLNPEPRAFWGTGDSEMPAYRNHCHELRPCRNLDQLADFISELIL
jgi:uncharacterized protein